MFFKKKNCRFITQLLKNSRPKEKPLHKVKSLLFKFLLIKKKDTYAPGLLVILAGVNWSQQNLTASLVLKTVSLRNRYLRSAQNQ